ncbi:TPA: biotin--[acetyl-CoA-carboxylase] ligase [Candidatus Woesearchaeota archaeon]|nr:biotin--[acetyl-CoA-carboxylase] ligase [Candidatus Woesearchaeota archaeon]HII65752.1 biotin--[acetyl-CoA-carboxylase] ligase [Candidatus Woesearchaeota archaeon]
MAFYTLKKYPCVSSTNEHAKRLAAGGMPEWTAVLAGKQLRGRGRRGRRWASPQGGLYLSIVLYPRRTDHVQVLTFAVALAVEDAIGKRHFLKTSIKWPNDVLLNGKKVCGILTETAFGSSISCIVGIGLNANQKRFSPRIASNATSLLIESGEKTDIDDLAHDILVRLKEYYAFFQDGKEAKVLDEWKKRCTTLGKNVRIASPSGSFSGKAVGVTEEGMLRVRLPSGRIRVVAEGDASVR